MSGLISARLVAEMDHAHGQAVAAAANGVADPALGVTRLIGPGISAVADAAVSSATPFLRAPLISRIAGAARLHPADGAADGRCPTCGVSAPCDTAQELA